MKFDEEQFMRFTLLKIASDSTIENRKQTPFQLKVNNLNLLLLLKHAYIYQNMCPTYQFPLYMNNFRGQIFIFLKPFSVSAATVATPPLPLVRVCTETRNLFAKSRSVSVYFGKIPKILFQNFPIFSKFKGQNHKNLAI